MLCSALAIVTWGASAQSPTSPTNFDPSVSIPGYAARKERQAASPRQALARVAPTGRTAAALPACFEPLDQTTYTPVTRGDDNFIGPINLGFTFSLFGTQHTQCYINTNGNISFGQGVQEYNSQGFPYNVPMIAAFWADVDTRNASSGQVWYKVYPDRLVVTWDNVSYYTSGATAPTALTNTFQIIIRRNTGGFSPSPDVQFAYGDMQWTTGEASSGTAGFGGTPATVGVNQGTGSNYIGTGRFNVNDSTPPQSSYPAGTTVFSGVNWLDNQCIGYTAGLAGNLPPTATGFPANNTINLTVGQTVSLPLQFSGPESGQTVTVTPDLTGLCNSSAPVGSGPSPIVNFSVTGAACNVGTRTVQFTATDNGSPVANQVFTLTVVVSPLYSWTGAVSSAYTVPGNWDGGVVPGLGDGVMIPAGVPNFPLLTTSVNAANFTVATGASMTIGTGGELTLSGNLVNNGTFTGTAGALREAGTAVQSMTGTGSYQLGELTVGSAGVSLGSGVSISKLLILNGTLATNGQSLQLLSNATGTAMVVNNGSATVTGAATVQRYIAPTLNAGAGYRHFSSPTTGATVNTFARPGFVPVVNANYNTVGNTVTPFPNVFGYDQSRVNTSGNTSTDFDRGFFSPTTTGDALVDTKGYTVNLPAFDASANPTGVPVRFTGTLHNGNYSSGALPRGTQPQSGWHLLGNPYPAPLDWNAAFAGASGLDNAVYVFKSTSQYGGGYDSYVNGIGTARYIGVAQGFFVRTTTPGTSGQLNFTNAARVTSYMNPTFNRVAPATADQRPQLRLELVSNGETDATYVYFQNGASPSFDHQYDAYKLPGGSQLYLATGTGSPAYSINGLPALTGAGAAVPLMTYLPQAGSFQLRLADLQNFGSASVQLEDRQTGTWYDLKLQPSLTFQVNQPAEAATRFVLHVNQARTLASKTAVLDANAVSVWPNPATGVLNLSVASLPAGADQLHLSLLNVLGQVVARQTADVRNGTAAASFDVRHLAPGVYTLKGNSSAASFTRSVIVQ